MSQKRTPRRRHSFLGAAFFSLLSIAVLQQTVTAYQPQISARLIPRIGSVAVSSSSVSSMTRKPLLSGRRAASSKSASSATLHKAAPALSPRRRSTGALIIKYSSKAPNVVIKAGCGDGLVTGAEECDDKNTKAADGCSATCEVETGFSCSSGQPSVCWSICGDGIPAANERCDDGNVVSEDGCTSTCKVELTYKCTGTPSACVIPAYCGNEVVETDEQCDDGNSRQYDGCHLCKIE